MAMKTKLSNVSAHPSVVAERTKLHTLQGELTKIRTELESTDADGAKRSAFEAAVDFVLGRGTAATQTPKPELGELYQQFRILSTAVERQRRTVADAEAAAAVEIAEAVKPEYRDILQKLKAAVLPLREAIAAESAFRQAMYANSVAFHTVGTAPLRGIGDESIAGWLAEISEKHAI